MKRLFTIVCAKMVSFAANAQVLYKISGNGLKNESYILGTCHIIGGGFLDTIPGANRVLNQVQQVCGELEMLYINNPDTAMALSQMMMMPADSIAQNIMTEQQFATLCQLSKEQYDIDLSLPQYAMLLRMYPTMLMVTVPQLSEMIKLQKAIAEGTASVDQQQTVMDIYLQQDARRMSKSVIGLETYSFQIKLLTSLLDMPLREQYDGVIEAFKNKDESMRQVEQLKEIYKSFDLEKLAQFMQSLDGFENLSNRVLDSRNEVWIEKIPSIMRDKSTLFAVGAGHLVGEKGILTLLQNQGYKVTAVKK